MQRPDAGEADAYGEGLDGLAAAAGTVLLVHSGAPEEATL